MIYVSCVNKSDINYDSFDHRIFLVRWSFHKYKCLWSVGSKGRGSNLQEETLRTYTPKLG